MQKLSDLRWGISEDSEGKRVLSYYECWYETGSLSHPTAFNGKAIDLLIFRNALSEIFYSCPYVIPERCSWNRNPDTQLSSKIYLLGGAAVIYSELISQNEDCPRQIPQRSIAIISETAEALNAAAKKLNLPLEERVEATA